MTVLYRPTHTSRYPAHVAWRLPLATVVRLRHVLALEIRRRVHDDDGRRREVHQAESGEHRTIVDESLQRRAVIRR